MCNGKGLSTILTPSPSLGTCTQSPWQWRGVQRAMHGGSGGVFVRCPHPVASGSQTRPYSATGEWEIDMPTLNVLQPVDFAEFAFEVGDVVVALDAFARHLARQFIAGEFAAVLVNVFV
jgi:hypothetical protein